MNKPFLKFSKTQKRNIEEMSTAQVLSPEIPQMHFEPEDSKMSLALPQVPQDSQMLQVLHESPLLSEPQQEPQTSLYSLQSTGSSQSQGSLQSQPKRRRVDEPEPDQDHDQFHEEAQAVPEKSPVFDAPPVPLIPLIPEAGNVDDADSDTMAALPLDPNFDFILKFTNPAGWKMLIDILSNLLTECQFFVVQNEKFQGIAINTTDFSKASFISARLDCQVATHGPQDFFVRLPSLMTINKRVTGRECIEMRRARGGDYLDIYVYDPNEQGASQFRSWSLSCLIRDQEDNVLNDLEFDYTIELKLNEFRETINCAKEFKAKDVCFKIFEPVVDPTIETTKRDIYFEISAIGEQRDSFTFLFHSEMEEATADSENPDGMIILRTGSGISADPHKIDTKKMQQKFCHFFSAEMLKMFMSSMKRPNMRMHLKKNIPLMLCHNLGSRSFINFVLGEKSDVS